jgi:hypothetical protein
VSRDEIDETIERLRRSLEPVGWSLTSRRSDRRASVDLDHELSLPMSLMLEAAGDPAARAGRFLSRPEISIVANAPDLMPNRTLVAALRKAAGAAAGGPGDLRMLGLVARVLESHGLLTSSESTWLEEAGVPWQQDRVSE